jgi:hypothetical protein
MRCFKWQRKSLKVSKLDTSSSSYSASRRERRRDDIVRLWENPQWQVRKQVVHDFSQAVSGEYEAYS